ncbi:MAG: serine/threonine protein kinase [Caulobacteraceae bacterium]
MFKKGEVLNRKYRIEKNLGMGGMGHVYLCTNLELGNKWAVKFIPADKVKTKTISEVEILKKLNHTNLPGIVDIFSDEKGLYIVESYIEGIPLDRLLRAYGSFAADTVTGWMLQLCDILIYLHGLKPEPIIYLDMKPSNIIITRGDRAVLVDFGISREYGDCLKNCVNMAGTGAYAAPEQLIKGGITDQRTDIYNMGITLYQLLFGRLPKGGAADCSTARNRAIARLCRIIGKCLESRKEGRYQSVEDLKEELLIVKSMLLIDGIRQELLFKIEIASVIMLSVAAYTATILGLLSL